MITQAYQYRARAYAYADFRSCEKECEILYRATLSPQIKWYHLGHFPALYSI